MTSQLWIGPRREAVIAAREAILAHGVQPQDLLDLGDRVLVRDTEPGDDSVAVGEVLRWASLSATAPRAALLCLDGSRPESLHALLKTIEEPAERTTFHLVSSTGTLSTIRSRCHVHTVPRRQPAELRDYARTHDLHVPERAWIAIDEMDLVHWAHAAPGLAGAIAARDPRAAASELQRSDRDQRAELIGGALRAWANVVPSEAARARAGQDLLTGGASAEVVFAWLLLGHTA